MNVQHIKFACATVTLAFWAIGCGAPTHVLESITVTPATATGSQVQFTATSHWNTDPLTVTPQSVNWNVCTPAGVASNLVTVSSSGLATCATGTTGSFTIYANHSVVPNTGPECDVVNDCGGGCGIITGTAQITCSAPVPVGSSSQ